MRSGFRICIILSLSLIFFQTQSFAAKDPTEVKLVCRVPTSQIQKGLAASIYEEGEYAGDTVKKVSVKLQKVKGQGSDSDIFFADDYLKKLKIGYKNGGEVSLNRAPKIKFEKCSFDYNITINVSGITSDGKTFSTSTTIEEMTLQGFYQ